VAEQPLGLGDPMVVHARTPNNVPPPEGPQYYRRPRGKYTMAPSRQMKIFDKRLYLSYTLIMKTAISLPDALFAAAEETAKSLGLRRSQLFAKALEEFISHHQKENITEKYNEIYTNNEIKQDTDELVTILNLRELTKNDSW